MPGHFEINNNQLIDPNDLTNIVNKPIGTFIINQPSFYIIHYSIGISLMNLKNMFQDSYLVIHIYLNKVSLFSKFFRMIAIEITIKEVYFMNLNSNDQLEMLIESNIESFSIKQGSTFGISSWMLPLNRPLVSMNFRDFIDKNNQSSNQIKVVSLSPFLLSKQFIYIGEKSINILKTGVYLLSMYLRYDVNCDVFNRHMSINLKVVSNGSILVETSRKMQHESFISLSYNLHLTINMNLQFYIGFNAEQCQINISNQSRLELIFLTCHVEGGAYINDPLFNSANKNQGSLTLKNGINLIVIDKMLCFQLDIMIEHVLSTLDCSHASFILVKVFDESIQVLKKHSSYNTSINNIVQSHVVFDIDTQSFQLYHGEQNLACKDVHKMIQLQNWLTSHVLTIESTPKHIELFNHSFIRINHPGIYLFSLYLQYNDANIGVKHLVVLRNSGLYDPYFKEVEVSGSSAVDFDDDSPASIIFKVVVYSVETFSIWTECSVLNNIFISNQTRISIIQLDYLKDELFVKNNVIFHPVEDEQQNDFMQLICAFDKQNDIQWFYNLKQLNASKSGYFFEKRMSLKNGRYACSSEYHGHRKFSRSLILKNIADNCVNTEHNCSENSMCVVVDRNPTCRCNEGFYENENVCLDIDECSIENSCFNFSTCRNSIGSYLCECHDGFIKDLDNNCQDINECEFTKCQNNSICINTDGSYECKCISGYINIAQNECQDIDECIHEESCPLNSECTNLDGSYECKCSPGWINSNSTCEDYNECSEVNDCHLNATCVNLPGYYQCMCNRGFFGDGRSNCQPLGCVQNDICPGELSVSWTINMPYSGLNSEAKVIGIFPTILQLLISECCNNCSRVNYANLFNDTGILDKAIPLNVSDIFFPLYGINNQKFYQGYPFISIVESPGISMYVREVKEQNNPLLKSILNSWPVLVITINLAAVSGMIIWILDTIKNPKDFPRSFFLGSWNGFWWAFISMTTVGYGDKAPKSVFARMFGVLWILTGLVIVSIFTATITTNLTTNNLSKNIKIYGSRIGTLENTEEYRLAVRRNADVRTYRSVQEIANALKFNDIDGALIEAYIAAEYQEILSGYRIQQVIDHSFTYGVVVSRHALGMVECFNNFIEIHQTSIYQIIANSIRPIIFKNQMTISDESSNGLFDMKSNSFIQMISIGFAILIVLIFIAIFVNYFYWKPKLECGQLQLFHPNKDLTNDEKDIIKKMLTLELNEHMSKHELLLIKDIVEKGTQIYSQYIQNKVERLLKQLEEFNDYQQVLIEELIATDNLEKKQKLCQLSKQIL